MDTSGIDLLNLISTKLRKVARTNGGEYHGVCPFCGGHDRFIVQPRAARWSCRQCSPNWQDAIAYVMKDKNLDFKGAVAFLGLDTGAAPQNRVERRNQPARAEAPHIQAPGALKTDYAALDPEYQRRADQFVTETCNRLWETGEGKAALEYLCKRRLRDATIGAAELGFNPVDRNETWGKTEVYLPAGIVIPWQIDGQYYRLNFRRMGEVDHQKRYISAAGAANGLYLADDLRPGCIAIVVEGEFDALAVRSGACELLPHGLVPVATGTASWGRLLRWVVKLSLAERVLLAFDADRTGEQAAAWWGEQLGNKAIRLPPLAHDVNDMLKEGMDLVAWITSAGKEFA